MAPFGPVLLVLTMACTLVSLTSIIILAFLVEIPEISHSELLFIKHESFMEHIKDQSMTTTTTSHTLTTDTQTPSNGHTTPSQHSYNAWPTMPWMLWYGMMNGYDIIKDVKFEFLRFEHGLDIRHWSLPKQSTPDYEETLTMPHPTHTASYRHITPCLCSYSAWLITALAQYYITTNILAMIGNVYFVLESALWIGHLTFEIAQTMDHRRRIEDSIIGGVCPRHRRMCIGSVVYVWLNKAEFE